MIGLKYSLVIEATEEPDYFGFYSPDLYSLRLNPGIPEAPKEEREILTRNEGRWLSRHRTFCRGLFIQGKMGDDGTYQLIERKRIAGSS